MMTIQQQQISMVIITPTTTLMNLKQLQEKIY